MGGVRIAVGSGNAVAVGVPKGSAVGAGGVVPVQLTNASRMKKERASFFTGEPVTERKTAESGIRRRHRKSRVFKGKLGFRKRLFVHAGDDDALDKEPLGHGEENEREDEGHQCPRLDQLGLLTVNPVEV